MLSQKNPLLSNPAFSSHWSSQHVQPPGEPSWGVTQSSVARASPALEPWVPAGLACTPVVFSYPCPATGDTRLRAVPSAWLAVGQPVGWIPFSVVFFQWAAVIVEVDRGWKKRFAALCSPLQLHCYEPTQGLALTMMELLWPVF